ncbi:hypothetical protein QBC39DRAFT_336484 [Podospora conica]|nr:hypothetical protein QBC39DRAFT_336484 [Schizothecium conicum]
MWSGLDLMAIISINFVPYCPQDTAATPHQHAPPGLSPLEYIYRVLAPVPTPKTSLSTHQTASLTYCLTPSIKHTVFPPICMSITNGPSSDQLSPFPATMDSESFYAVSFKDQADNCYVYIKILAQGTQGAAQLVRRFTDDGPLMVRKIERPPVHGTEAPDALNEVRISELLQAMALTPNGMKFDKPFIIALHGTHSTRLPDNLWARESYWSFCNGGTIANRMWSPASLGFARPPFAAIGKYVRQVGSSLLFMRFAGPKPVYHHDMHLSNIFLHFVEGQDLPDFYIGDLGWSNDSPIPPPGWPGPNPTARRETADMYNFHTQIETFARLAKGDQTHQEAAENLVSHAESLMSDPTEARLRELVQMGTQLEQRCTTPGIWDERERWPHYQNFVAVGKAVLAEQSTTLGAPCFFGGRGRSDADIQASLEDVFGPWHLLKARNGDLVVNTGDAGSQLLTELGYGGLAALPIQIWVPSDESEVVAKPENTKWAVWEAIPWHPKSLGDKGGQPYPVVAKPENTKRAVWEAIPWHPKSLGDKGGQPYPTSP